MKTLKFMLSLFLLFAPVAVYADGFTVQVEPTSRPYTVAADGKLTTETQYGLVIKFCSDDPQVVAFAGEVSYRLENSKISERADITAWPNFNKCGVSILWVGKAAEFKAVGWEVTGISRRSESTNPN